MKAETEPHAARNGGDRDQDARDHRWIIPYALVFAGGLLVSGFTILRGIGVFDEGLALQAANRVGDGQLPYRDFAWAYGPAQPLILGGLAEVFGQSLLWWRILRVAVDAAIGVLVFALVRRQAPPWLAALAALTAVTGFSQPTDPNPMAPALAFALGAVLMASRSTITAGVLAGVAAAFRLDFGVYALIGVLAALAVQPGFARGAIRAGAGWLGTVAVAYLPFVMLAGPGDVWEEVIGRSLADGAAWRLPFPLAYDGGLSGLGDAKDVLDFYVPLLLLAGLGAAGVALALRRPPPAAAAGLLGLALGGLAYLFSRTDELHALPLIVIAAALLALAWAPLRRHPLAFVLPLVLLMLAAHGVGNRVSALVRPPDLERLDVELADGVRAPPRDARGIEGMVAAVERRVPPGAGIYSVTRRSDLVPVNNPLVYVLTQRPNVLGQDFGLNTSPRAQRRLVAALAAERPAAIVRWTHPESVLREDNRRGRPSGSRALDEWIAANYRPAERHGDYVVLVPR